MYKLHSRGYVIPAFFNWDENIIGPYEFESEFGYSEEYHYGVAEPNKHWLYKAMSEDSSVVACFFVNASYVCCMKADGTYYYIDLDTGLSVISSKKWQGYHLSCAPVGYQKTAYKCQSVYLPPAAVLYSTRRKELNVNGVWKPVHDELDIGCDLPLSMYSELVHSDHSYFYVKEGGEVVWKDF